MSVRIPFPPTMLERRTLAQMSGGWGRALRAAGSLRGQWKCELETLSPLCIKTLFQDCRARNVPPYIPGSSLRGMFRNMVQVIGAGCTLDYGDAHRRDDLKPCTLSGGLCLACRLFGTVGTSADSAAWTGKVRVRDTAAVKLPKHWASISPSGPRDSGTTDRTDGWVLFKSDEMDVEAKAGGGLICAPAGMTFPFSVEFDNLDDEEAAVLQFVITLQHGKTVLLHKLGFGKALGLGTIAVQFDQSEKGVYEGPMDRYASGVIWELLQEHRR